MKKIFAFLLTCMLLFSLSAPAFATSQAVEDINDFQNEMEEYLKNNQLPIEVENFSVSLRTDVDLSQYSDGEISNLLQKDMDHLKSILSSSESRLIVKPQPRLTRVVSETH